MRGVAVLLALGVFAAGSGAAAAQTTARTKYEGRILTDVLRELQAGGLKIVFSSELVKPELRVVREPAARKPRGILDEVLKPHGLQVRAGPRSTLLVVRAPAPPRVAPSGPGKARGAMRGKVLDARTATPLPGVVVTVQRSTSQTVTDAAGMFALSGVESGAHTLHVSLVGYALAEPRVQVPPGGTVEVTIALADGTGSFRENVTVTADRFRGEAGSVPSALSLNSAELFELRGGLTDDPFRAIQALPGGMTGNDFRSEFSVRGSDPGHLGLIIDGVQTGWPVHAVRDHESSGSVALINGDIVEQVTLAAGAYPQAQPGPLGASVNLAIREGSRTRRQVHGALGMTAAALVAEGPLGSTGSGSWLASVRQSYLQWLLSRIDRDGGTAFGFTDAQAKLVYDVTPRQQVRLTLAAGRSELTDDRRHPDADDVRSGSARTGLAIAGWQGTVGSSVVLVQRAAFSGLAFRNQGSGPAALADGSRWELSYRGAVTWMPSPSLAVHAGAHVQRREADEIFIRPIDTADGVLTAVSVERVDGVGSIVSGNVRLSYTGGNGLTIDGGVLVSDPDYGAGAVEGSPWLSGSIPLGPVTVRAGGGIYRQLPDIAQVAGTFGRADAGAERARHLELALDWRWNPDVHLQVTAYDRDERDRLILIGNDARLVGDTLVFPSPMPAWDAGLTSSSRGIELLVQRRAPTGLGGWIGYAYSRTEDEYEGVRYPADFDQRHTFNAFLSYRLSARSSVSGRVRLGSNFPVPGYLEEQNGQFFVAAARNAERLPVYGRFDLRATRVFNREKGRLTLFAEVSNVFNRTNYAPDEPRVLPDGRVIATLQRLFPILPTAGLLFEF